MGNCVDIGHLMLGVEPFIDFGGHQRCLKTAAHTYTSLVPDYAMLAVPATSGVSRMTREHLAMALALGVPSLLLLCCLRVDAAMTDRPTPGEDLSEVDAVLLGAPGSAPADGLVRWAGAIGHRDAVCAQVVAVGSPPSSAHEGPRPSGSASRHPAP